MKTFNFLLLSIVAIGLYSCGPKMIYPGEVWTDTEQNMINAHGSIKNYEELEALLDRLFSDKAFLSETGANAGYYVTSNAGATERILHMINF